MEKTALAAMMVLAIGGFCIYLLTSTSETAFTAALKKHRAFARAAKQHDQHKILRGLPQNDYNGYYFRFDDNLSLAARSGTRGEPVPAPFPADLHFSRKQEIRMGNSGDRLAAVAENGLLRFRKSSGLTLIFPAHAAKASIGTIEIRARHTKGHTLFLGWSSRAAGAEENSVDIDVIPDGRFHTYRVDAKSILNTVFARKRGDTIKRIFLCPSDAEGDSVDIDYIRFLSRSHRYQQSSFGTSAETKNNELRQVLYAYIPSALTYRVSVPRGRSVLRFGAGILQNAPVSFEVRIDGSRIFHAHVTRSDRWTDHRIPMNAYAGQTIEITFAASGSPDNIAFWSNPVLHGIPSKRYNIIFVLEDALRADHLSCYGYGRKTTPVKDAWARSGVLFEHNFAQATKTRPSCPSIMTSLHPSATGVWNFHEQLGGNYLTIAEILRSQGFQTAAFVQNVNAGPAAGLHQGYSQLFDEYGGDSASLYSRAVPCWLEKNSTRNFFLYLHVMDPHGPYDPVKRFRSWHADSAETSAPLQKNTTLFDPEWVEVPTVEGRRARYDGEIRNNDHHFASILKKLHDLGIAEKTLVVFLSDHGEHLGEHGQWEHRPPGYIQVIRTPLIMVYPRGLPGNIVIREPVQNLDIAPTVLDLAGIDTGNLLLQGDSLVPLIRRQNLTFWQSRIILSEEVYDKQKTDDSPWASVISGSGHVLNSRTVDMVRFDYGADQCELIRHPVPGRKKRFLTDFIREIQSLNQKAHRQLHRETSSTVNRDPETVKQLKELGYM